MSKELEALGLVKRTCELYIETTRFLKGSDIIANQIKEALDIINQSIIKAQEPKQYADELKLVENKLKALEIIKKFIWVEDGKLKCGRFGDIEIELDKSDFESKEYFDTLKEVLE